MFRSSESFQARKGIFKSNPIDSKHKAYCRQIQISNKIRELNCLKAKMEDRIDQLMYQDTQMDDQNQQQRH